MSVYHKCYSHQVTSPHWKLIFKQQIHTMFKKSSKRKEKEAKPESDVEVISMMKTKFDDTKAIIEVSPELKWGEIYKIIRDQNIPYVSIEEMFLYQNIKM